MPPPFSRQLLARRDTLSNCLAASACSSVSTVLRPRVRVLMTMERVELHLSWRKTEIVRKQQRHFHDYVPIWKDRSVNIVWIFSSLHGFMDQSSMPVVL